MPSKDLLIAANTLWVVVAAVLVMFMQAGFAFLEAGLTRMKNAAHIAGKNVLIFGLCSLVYWAVGFGIAFGDGNGIIGTQRVLPVDDELLVDRPGAVLVLLRDPCGERLHVRGRLRRCLARNRLGGDGRAREALGLLRLRRRLHAHLLGHLALDLARGRLALRHGACRISPAPRSSTTRERWQLSRVRSCSGPRIGKFGRDGRANPIPGHNMPYAVLGTIILWFGWFGFNPGSTLGVVTGDRIGYFGYVALTTNLAAAAGAVGGLASAWWILQQAGHLDDAERRPRRARRDHRCFGLRRALGRDRHRAVSGLDRRGRRAVRRADRHRRSDRRRRRARDVRCLGDARDRHLRGACTGVEPRHRHWRARLHRLVPSTRRPGARPRRRRRVHVLRFASARSG